jgi:hypothetical protein
MVGKLVRKYKAEKFTNQRICRKIESVTLSTKSTQDRTVIVEGKLIYRHDEVITILVAAVKIT